MTRPTRREMIGGGAAMLAAVSSRAALAHPSQPELPMGEWAPAQPMLFPVQEIYPTAFWRGSSPRGVLVSAGGQTKPDEYPFGVTNVVTSYDPLTKLWRYGTPLPQPRHNVALVSHMGFLYAVGGYLSDAAGGWRMQNSVWRIGDVEADNWSTKTSLPIPQSEGVAASLGGRLHVVGGRSPGGSSNREWRDHIETDLHWAYEARSDRWEPRRPIPTPRSNAASAVVGNWGSDYGTLYVMGGRTRRDGNTPVCEVYEAFSDRWQAVRPMPKPIRQEAPQGQSDLAAVYWNRKIYVFGGEWRSGRYGGVYADVWEYDPFKDTWRAVAPMPAPRHGHGAVALSDGIYVCGGGAGPGYDGTSGECYLFKPPAV